MYLVAVRVTEEGKRLINLNDEVVRTIHEKMTKADIKEVNPKASVTVKVTRDCIAILIKCANAHKVIEAILPRLSA